MKYKGVKTILALALSFLLIFQGTGTAQIVISVPINLYVKVTTHPDTYNTKGDLLLSAPVIADLNADFSLEVICAGYNSETNESTIFVWKRTGLNLPGWPIVVPGRILDAPSVGDIDGDGELEIIVGIIGEVWGEGNTIYAWKIDGGLVEGYPKQLETPLNSILVGDTKDGHEEEIVAESDIVTFFIEDGIIFLNQKSIALADINSDGKKEIVSITPEKAIIKNGKGEELTSWQIGVDSIGKPVIADLQGDGSYEILAPVRNEGEYFIYAWDTEGSLLENFPIETGINNVPSYPLPIPFQPKNSEGGILESSGRGDFISVADITGDGIAEIITGGRDGKLAVFKINGEQVFKVTPPVENEDENKINIIYQPVVGDIDEDGSLEILVASSLGYLYCYASEGTLEEGWPKKFDYDIGPGLILVDIDQDTSGDLLNPAGDLELFFTGADNKVHSIDLPGNFNPSTNKWPMYGFDPRRSHNYLRDWDTKGWSILDDEPEGAEIKIVYDWNRGNRVIEFVGDGLNNTYAYTAEDDKPLDIKKSKIQWAMRFSQDFAIYISIDTIKGKRYLYYTPVDNNELMDETGKYIHHGLGTNVINGKWHIFVRDLMTDLQEAEPDNKIMDINGFYIQGNGRIDNLLFLEGQPCAELENLALDAEAETSSNSEEKGNVNDGDPNTIWHSGDELIPWIKYSWDDPQKINNIIIKNVNGSKGGVIFIFHENGTVEEAEFEIPAGKDELELVFDTQDDVTSIIVVFDNDEGTVTAGEIEVYYNPNYDNDDMEEEEEDITVEDYLQMKDGFLWDPTAETNGEYFIPHGIAYPTWNMAAGVWQNPFELHKDIELMHELGVNAIKVDFVWKNIETENDQFSWENYDLLLEECKAYGIKVFPIIVWQEAPAWLGEETRTMYMPDAPGKSGEISPYISFENPVVQAEMLDFLQEVVSRYTWGGIREDLAPTIGAWLLGENLGYLDYDELTYTGYDDWSIKAFREWLEKEYDGDIVSLNQKWSKDTDEAPGYLPDYPYQSFEEVDMPVAFVDGEYVARNKASWYDLIQWRKYSTAQFIARCAQAVKNIDPYHLISYVSTGVQYKEDDWRFNTDDAKKIVEICEENGTGLDFWCINNYPWALENSELISGKWGIIQARHDTKLPVLVTETGFTTTETLYAGIDEDRQATLVKNTVLESLSAGTIGVFVFTLKDRDSDAIAEREKGFGLLTTTGNEKPAYVAVKDTFEELEKEINLGNLPAFRLIELFYTTKLPESDIAFLKTEAVSTIINRYNAEMEALFGTLERLGFEPSFINYEEILNGEYMKYKAIVLPRNQKMSEEVLTTLPTIALDGVKIHANVDLPGIMDEYGYLRNGNLEWQIL